MKKFLLISLLFGALAISLSSCKKEKPTVPQLNLEIPTEARAFILNAGSFKGNNANLTYFDPAGVAAPIGEVFFKQNEKKIGDTGESMILADGKIYIAVYGSNLIYKLSKDGVLEASRSLYNPRQIAYYKGHLYVTKHAGQVTKLDAVTLDSITSVNVGHNLEGIAELNDMLYVCDSHDGVDNKIKYEDIFVINPQTMQSEGTIKVVKNPTDLIVSNGRLYCLSQGDYALISYAVQVIDPQEKHAKPIAVATCFTLGGDILYMVNSETDWSDYPNVKTHNTFLAFNTKTGKMLDAPYLNASEADGLESTPMFSMHVDPRNGSLYLATSDFKNNGDIFQFNKKGNFIRKFDSGGINPKDIVFIQ